MPAVEGQIARWRAYVDRSPALDGPDTEELEAHLREQIAELEAAGLTSEEAFLVGVKRLGSVDGLSREYALAHSDRLWRQLVLAGGDDAHPEAAQRWRGALG